MQGFMIWIHGRWREWDQETGKRPASSHTSHTVHTHEDHQAFDAWLAERFPEETSQVA